MRRTLLTLIIAISLLGVTPAAYADWSLPKFLTSDNQGVTADRHVVVANADGDMIVATILKDGDTVLMRRMARGKTKWGTPKTYTSADNLASDASGAMDQEGRACIAWHSSHDTEPTPSRIRAACFKPGAGWGRVKVLSEGNSSAYSPQVVMSHGVATVIWFQNGTLRTRRWDNGAWGKALNSNQSNSSQFDAGIDAKGRITVALGDWDISPGVVIRTISPSGTWSAPHDVCAADEYCDEPAVAVNANGTALATWVLGNPSGAQVAVATHRLKGGDWGEAETVYEAQGALDIGVTSDGSTNTFAVGLVETYDNTNTLLTRHRFPVGPWSGLKIVDSEPHGAYDATMQLQMDADHVVTVVWRNDYSLPWERARVLSDGQTMEGVGSLSNLGRLTAMSDDLAIALRGTHQIEVVWRDQPDVPSPFRLAWAEFTP